MSQGKQVNSSPSDRKGTELAPLKSHLSCAALPRLPRGRVSGDERSGHTSHKTCLSRECRWAARTTRTWWDGRRRAPRTRRRCPERVWVRRGSGNACGTCPCGQSWCRAGKRTTERNPTRSHRCGRSCRSRAAGQRRRGTAPHTAA